jgi:hypothetical protein
LLLGAGLAILTSLDSCLSNAQQKNFQKKVYRARPVLSKVEGSTKQNPKSEARNPKQSGILKFEIQNDLVWNLLIHLSLFRISDFEFRIYLLGAAAPGRNRP